MTVLDFNNYRVRDGNCSAKRLVQFLNSSLREIWKRLEWLVLLSQLKRCSGLQLSRICPFKEIRSKQPQKRLHWGEQKDSLKRRNMSQWRMDQWLPGVSRITNRLLKTDRQVLPSRSYPRSPKSNITFNSFLLSIQFCRHSVIGSDSRYCCEKLVIMPQSPKVAIETSPSPKVGDLSIPRKTISFCQVCPVLIIYEKSQT